MAKITYRHLKKDELLTASRLFQRSFNHLRRKNNRPTYDDKITEVSPFIHHTFKTDRKGYWGAFDGEKMIGFGHAGMRGKQWYLSNLFVAPKSQVKGVGGELLKRCLRYGKGKADSYSLCTFSYNEVSLALYSSFGIMPIYPIFVMYRKIDKNFRIRPTGLKVVEDNSNKSILRIGWKKRSGDIPVLPTFVFMPKAPMSNSSIFIKIRGGSGIQRLSGTPISCRRARLIRNIFRISSPNRSGNVSGLKEKRLKSILGPITVLCFKD
jgi:GNAT superfamily N-acetyltransferase